MSLKYTVAIGDWRESNRIGLLCCGQNRTIHKLKLVTASKPKTPIQRHNPHSAAEMTQCNLQKDGVQPVLQPKPALTDFGL